MGGVLIGLERGLSPIRSGWTWWTRCELGQLALLGWSARFSLPTGANKLKLGLQHELHRHRRADLRAVGRRAPAHELFHRPAWHGTRQFSGRARAQSDVARRRTGHLFRRT